MHNVTPNAPGFIWALAFFISSVAIVGPYGQKWGYTPDLHMSAYVQVFGFGLLTVLLFSWFKRRTILFPSVKMVILPIALLYVWISVSFIWVHNFYEFLVDFLYWSGALVCGLLVLLLVNNMKAVRVMLMALFISGFLIALLGIGQVLFGIDWVQQHIVPAATFSNKNMAGQYGLLTLPLAMVFFLEAKERPAYWFYAIASSLIISYMFYTRSRAVWVSGIVTTVMFFGLLFYWRYIQGYKLIHSVEKIVAIVVAICLSIVMFSFTPKTFGFEKEVERASIGTTDATYHKESGLEIAKAVIKGGSNTADIRSTIWLNSIPMFVDHFFLGVGFGNWITQYSRYQAWYKQDSKLLKNQFHANAHNDYVEFICEFGIVGILLFIWVMVGLFRVMVKVLSNKKESTFSILALGPVTALLAIGIDANFSFPLKQPVPIMIVFVYISMLCCIYCIRQGEGWWHVVTLPAKLYTQASAVVFTLITTVLLNLQYQWYQSELQYRIAVTSLKSDAPGAAKRTIQAARQAYKYNPFRTRLLWLEGTSLLKLNSVEEGLAKLEQALDAYPYSDSTIVNLVSSYYYRKEFNKALYLLRELEKVRPYQGGYASKNLANIHMAILQKLGLYEDLKKIIQIRLAVKEDYYRATVASKENRIKSLQAAGKPVLEAQQRAKRRIEGVSAQIKKLQLQIAAIDKKNAERETRLASPLLVKADNVSTSPPIQNDQRTQGPASPSN